MPGPWGAASSRVTSSGTGSILYTCRNCCRSDRQCERGLRLNFIDIQTSTLHPSAGLRPGTKLIFRDESRTIASKYNVNSAARRAPILRKNDLPQLISQDEGNPPLDKASVYEESLGLTPTSQSSSSRLIDDMDESLLMEVFLQKVAPRLDCLDTCYKPFTNIIPLCALSNPMLYSSIMMCSMSYLSLDDVGYEANMACQESQPLAGKSKQEQLLSLVTEVLLGASNAISGGTDSTHMNHAAILMREAGVSGSSPGLAGTVFWSHALMQLTHGLYHNLPPSLHLESFDNVASGQHPAADAGPDILFGQETYWVHRIIYICTRISVLHAELTRNICEYSQEKIRADCEEYRSWCHDWASSVPRSMTPLCYVHPGDCESKSSTPYVLLISSTANISRLLYHTACLLLADMMPVQETYGEQAEIMRRRHAVDICGIASQAEERAFTHVATCCLMVAAKALPKDSGGRQEALDILDRITHGTPLASSKACIVFDSI
ncbi:hypothetical protein B0I35DRAFT_515344 [Stachybotrys elegans]|uniref:Transcription factor domain-containing protein n=1 Tax=Stachybotrys elegans TaxID=80388 RepID=A0A8K0SLM1_9HYPO|nr:hypothetical protein B0I35DRAFT_515344 [Stachybotrys elegans]